MRRLHDSRATNLRGNEAIRHIFLHRRSEYSPREAASLLGLTAPELRSWIDSGRLEIERRPSRARAGAPRGVVSWQELASAALLRWTVLRIHDALGDDAGRVLPRLLRPVELGPLRFPEYQLRLIEIHAEAERASVEDYVHSQLLSVEVAADPDAIERLVPGFREAIAFPFA